MRNTKSYLKIIHMTKAIKMGGLISLLLLTTHLMALKTLTHGLTQEI